MKSQTILKALTTHGEQLISLRTRDGDTYTNSGHEIVPLYARQIFKIRTRNTPSSNYEYVDFDEIAKMVFSPDITPITDVGADQEDVYVNETTIYKFVTNTDINNNPNDYVALSLGQVKTVRVFKSDAIVGDPCIVKTLKYRIDNPNLIPSHTIRSTALVTSDDLL